MAELLIRPVQRLPSMNLLLSGKLKKKMASTVPNFTAKLRNTGQHFAIYVNISPDLAFILSASPRRTSGLLANAPYRSDKI